MSVNNSESFADGGHPIEADRAWFRIVRRVAGIRGRQTQEFSIQTSQREANGEEEVPFIPSSEELKLMLADMNTTTTTRRAIHASLALFDSIETLESVTELMMPSDADQADDDSDQADDDDEKRGIELFPSQVEDFMQTLSRVEMGTLGTDDLRCPI